jgi:hypothetical protein
MDENQLQQFSDTYKLNPAVPQKLPKPTFWPVFTAFSVILFFWGFITSFIISIAGVISLGVSLYGWIMELKQ